MNFEEATQNFANMKNQKDINGIKNQINHQLLFSSLSNSAVQPNIKTISPFLKISPIYIQSHKYKNPQFKKSQQQQKMSQLHQQSKKKILKLIQSTIQKLQSLDLNLKFKYKSTNDPLYDLQLFFNQIFFLFQNLSSNHLPNQHHFQQVKSNDNLLLQSIKQFKNVYIILSKFSKFLLDGQQSRQLCKTYRKLHKSISTISNNLYKYQSQDQNFQKQKYQLINQNIKTSQQLKNQTLSTTKNKPSQQPQQNQNDQQTITDLQKQIDFLNQVMRQNDQQYTQQIQSYNNTLYGMQQTIRQYQMRMDKVKQYENIIDQLQHKLIRFKQEKYRDDMLIDNMSKKIRIYEKQRNGVDAFISPRGSFGRKNFISPTNRAYQNQNQSVYPYGAGGTLPMRNYY